jgi:hypothetical protein
LAPTVPLEQAVGANGLLAEPHLCHRDAVRAGPRARRACMWSSPIRTKGGFIAILLIALSQEMGLCE